MSLLDDVSRETHERLTTYLRLLEKWNPKINLVSSSTISDAWSRHFVDSAQLLECAPDEFDTWVDLGSGGGFPGLVIAVLLAKSQPTVQVTLVESDQRKSAFLRTVIRETNLSAKVLSKRIEEADPQAAAVISARALASLPVLLALAARHATPKTTMLFPKGRKWQGELEEAQREWCFKHVAHPSKTDPEAVILRIEEIEHV